MDRRRTIVALVMGALAAVALVAARRGVPGAKGLGERLARGAQPLGRVERHGYREVNLS